MRPLQCIMRQRQGTICCPFRGLHLSRTSFTHTLARCTPPFQQPLSGRRFFSQTPGEFEPFSEEEIEAEYVNCGRPTFEQSTAGMAAAPLRTNAKAMAFLQRKLTGLHSKIVKLTLDTVATELNVSGDSGRKLRALDCGSATGGLSLTVASNSDAVASVTGIDLNDDFIVYAQSLAKSAEKCAATDFHHFDARFLSHVCDANEFDVAFIVLVTHDLPPRMPITLLTQLSQVSRFVAIADWLSPLPWNGAGVRNRCIELLMGVSHFAAFRKYISPQFGGVGKCVEQLCAQTGASVVFHKAIDGRTTGFYVLDTRNVVKPSLCQ